MCDCSQINWNSTTPEQDFSSHKANLCGYDLEVFFDINSHYYKAIMTNKDKTEIVRLDIGEITDSNKLNLAKESTVKVAKRYLSKLEGLAA